MPGRIDLHTHTTVSDGTLSPAVLLGKAVQLGVRILSITDHDSTEGYNAVAASCVTGDPLRLIPGIEMSAEGDLPCHLLGYFINPHHPGFQEQLEGFRQRRVERTKAMVQKLRALNIPIELSRVMEISNGGTVGRPHIADALIERGVVRNRQEAFDRFLKRSGPAFVAGDGPSSRECIELILAAGGVPSLAHPSYYTSHDLLKTLADQGLAALEVYYPEHSRSLIAKYLELAESLNLIPTGGSDFHGPRTGRKLLACVDVPEKVVDELERRKGGG